MGSVLLVVLMAVEVCFFIWSVYVKRTHLIEKSIVNLGITVLFVLGLSSRLITWSFRYYLLVLYISLKVVFGLWTLVSRKEKKYWLYKTVNRFVFNSLLVCFVTLPALVFPEFELLAVSGNYTVETAKYTWTDNSRVEEYESGNIDRTLTVDFWFPTNQNEHYPLVIFSHGAFGYSGSNYSTFMNLASNGYIVASISHTYQAFFTQDMAGKVTIVDQGFINEAIQINGIIDTRNEEKVFQTTQSWMKLRTSDMNFVINQIIELSSTEQNDTLFSLVDTSKIGVFGHSLGGATAAQIGRIRNDIDAVIVLDGTMLGEEVDFQDGSVVLNDQPYPVPLLNIYAEDHYDNALTYVGENYNNFFATKNGNDMHETVFLKAGHLNFTDLPLFSPGLAHLLGVGSVDERACILKMNEVIVSFFDYYLKDSGNLQIEKEY